MGILICECALIVEPNLGFVLYSLLVAGVLIALSKFEVLNNESKTLIALLVIPIIKIAEIFIDFNFLWKVFIFYIIFGSMAVYYFIRFEIKANFSRASFKRIIIALILGISLGIAGRYVLNIQIDQAFIALIPLVAFSEELFFRGILQNLASKSYGERAAIFLTSLLFFIFTLSLGVYPAVFFFVVSFLIGLLYEYSQNVFLCILASACINAIIMIF